MVRRTGGVVKPKAQTPNPNPTSQSQPDITNPEFQALH
jgi:hypothetical protein